MAKSLKKCDEKNVWFVTGVLPPHFSGAGRNDLLLAHLCSKNGINVTLVTSRYPDDSITDVVNGVKVLRLRLGNDFNIISRLIAPLNFLKQLFINPRPAVIRFRGFSFRVGLMVFLVKLFYKDIKIIVQPALFGADDAFTIRKKPLGKFLIKQLHRTDSIFAMNELIKESFIAFKYPKKKIIPVNNPIDFMRFAPLKKCDKRLLRKDLGLKENYLIFITSGILSSRKRQSFITEAFLKTQLKTNNPNIILIHMGPTASDLFEMGRPNDAYEAFNEEKKIKSLINSNRQDNKVLLIGNQAFPEKWLQAADCFIHASIFEGEANVINEAMATGLTCIVPDNRLYYEKIPKRIKFERFIENDVESLVNVLENIFLNPKNEILNPNFVRKAILEKKDANRFAIQYCDSILNC